MSIPPYGFSFSSIGSEIDALFSEMEARAAECIPQSRSIKTAVKNAVPRITGNFHVDMCETENEIIIVCDLPGVEKSDVSIRLINPTTLVIKTDIITESITNGTYHLQERRAESGQRTIILPAKVNPEEAKASFRNGIMEITLPKAEPEEGIKIAVE
ncbi:MAG: Hsp20/alpha crystallin family protein [Methanocorpusculum sp.]|nr:Hsp20/alpha crystallin family protein [Methanocorpusculum sp.]